ncbi:MFS transporter [Corynebacterium cystitidis]|uniref:MFS transporter, AAHS family, benzoate transport protein n=1 Tax=Corynebacterium cystitidis DSM 20524 TaxID=1121357 RepID=A0A1H9TR86_9CORY|nr:aromatic acid/H+ symport family MFS transporter [Corynebacterium cystitidis]WJY81990.1 4-hydroxybenzoate transporter PcaK [Corynebacterium cystitidis DSM 20524]SER99549.1 MFS transporter, AAHS family, benzoate transport protein [Corynebacterium cystitidis DSM 20524]SNV81171.1 benzoate transporter [Corynebacterium cystitidis]
MASLSSSSGFTVLGISGRRLAAVLIGWFFVIFDGYDLIVYGTVQGALMNEWGISAAQAGTVGSAAFVGMVIGAVFIGRISDQVGRKFAVIGSVIVLSVFTVLCAFALGPIIFAVFRLLAGIGLGGLVPSVNAMTSDLVPPNRMSAWSTVMMSGVPLGGSFAAVLAQFIVPFDPHWGWRTMFLIAFVPLIIGLPIAMKVIPSDQAIAADYEADHQGEGVNAEKPGFGAILGASYRTVTIWFAIATFMTLLAWFGLGTWLPKLMTEDGYDFGAALNFTLALNLGAIIGSVVTAWAGDKFGPVLSGSVAAGVAGIALLLLLPSPPIWAVYLILVLAGVGTHGTQILIIAAVTQFYPHDLRGTALGWALGVGRLGAVVAPQMAGLLLTWGLGVNSNYLMFAIAALLSSLSLFILADIRRRQIGPAQHETATIISHTEPQ